MRMCAYICIYINASWLRITLAKADRKSLEGLSRINLTI